MALFNEILTGSLANILTRRLGMQVGSPAPTLAPEIMPTLVLENDRVEWEFLKGERRAGAGFDVATGAAASSVQFRNPPTSGQLIVIESVLLTSTPTVQVRLFPPSATPPDLATTVTSTPTDTRFAYAAPTRNTATQVSSENGLAINPGSFVVLRLSGGTGGQWVNLGAVLVPGAALLLNTLAAAALQGSVIFRERALVPGEQIG